MSWDLEELAARTSSREQRRPTRSSASRRTQYIVVASPVRPSRTPGSSEPNQRSQPGEVSSQRASRLAGGPSAADSRSGANERVQEEPPDMPTPRPPRASVIANDRRAQASIQARPHEQLSRDTPEPIVASSTARDLPVRTRERTAHSEDQVQVNAEQPPSLIIPERSSVPFTARGTASQPVTPYPREIQESDVYESSAANQAGLHDHPRAHSAPVSPVEYPMLNQEPNEGDVNTTDQYTRQNPLQISGEAFIRSNFLNQNTVGGNSQYLSEIGFVSHGPQGNQQPCGYYGIQGPQGTYEAYTNLGIDVNHGTQWRNGNHGVNYGRGESSATSRGASVGLSGSVASHSLASALQVPGSNHHNIQFQNQLLTQQPFYTPQLHYTPFPSELRSMPPPQQQQGYGNPGFNPPPMNDPAAMQNTYGFPLAMPQVPTAMNGQNSMQIPHPAGNNAFFSEPISRPQTQVHNPFPQPSVTPGTPYGPPPLLGSQASYYHQVNGTTSPMPLQSNPGEAMTLDMVTHPSVMPFENGTINCRPDQWGVAKIKNIPYAVTKQEIIHFIGRNNKLITPDMGCPVHIIMERSTSKTMDCYVEFMTQADAEAAVKKINRIYETGRIPRLGSRHVDVEVSSQDALLKDLFPRAKQIIWRNGVPILGPNNDPYSTGFQGFFTHEEIFLLIRHAEQPQRSPFSVKCLWRAYECTISTLKKFPWFATNMYTVEDRNQLFTVTFRHINALLAKVEKSKVVGLDRKLLSELLEAGLKCPGFNERQKFALIMASKVQTEYRRVSATSRYWPFDTLCMKPNTTDATIMYYANLVQKGLSIKDPSTQTLGNSYCAEYQGESPFGRIWLEWGFNNTYRKFDAAAEYELDVARGLVCEGYTNSTLTAGPALLAGSLQHQQTQIQSQPQDQNQNQGVSQMQHGTNGVGHLAPPQAPASASLSFGGNFGAPFSGPSFFPPTRPATGDTLPTQLATIPPGSMPMWQHGPAGAQPQPQPNFNMPLPHIHHQQQNIPNIQVTAPTATGVTNGIGGVNGGRGVGAGGFNNQNQNQTQNLRPVQRPVQAHGQGQSHNNGQNHGQGHGRNRQRGQNRNNNNNHANNTNNTSHNSTPSRGQNTRN